VESVAPSLPEARARVLFRTVRRTLVLICACAVSTASAQPATGAKPDPRDVAATGYAPSIWLGPSSIVYPMLPHPFAFDGIDNDDDGCTDLEDGDEIRAIVGPHDDAAKRLEVERLMTRLRTLRRFALLVDADTLVDAEKLRKELADGTKREDVDPTRLAALDAVDELIKATPTAQRSDTCRAKSPGAARGATVDEFKLCERLENGLFQCGPEAAVLSVARTMSPELLGMSVKEKQEVASGSPKKRSAAGGGAPLYQTIQYWLYYPWDGDHLHDGEHVTVFIDLLETGVKAVVGAGHLPSTANNVLVAATRQASSGFQQHIRFPELIPPHMVFLSELGKHASAPDLNCNGRFDPGYDANDLSSGAWGTRDVNYAIGKLSWTKFDPTTSFDRQADDLLVERSTGERLRALKGKPDFRNRTKDYAGSCPELSLGNNILKSRIESATPERFKAGSFRVVQAEDVRDLVKLAIDNPDAVLTSDVYRRVRGDRHPSRSVDASALKSWAPLSPVGSTNPRPDVWHHRDYPGPQNPNNPTSKLRPNNDFKLNLLPKISGHVLLASEGGNLKPGLSLRFAGVGPIRDSSVELQVLVDNFRPWGGATVASANRDVIHTLDPRIDDGKGLRWEGVLFYNSFSTAFSGPYFGLSVKQADYTYRSVLSVPDSKGSPTGTYSVFVEKAGPGFNLEAGYSYRLPFNKSVRLRVGISGPILRNSKDPTDQQGLRYYRYPTGVEVRGSVELSLPGRVGKIVRRKHPLAK